MASPPASAASLSVVSLRALAPGLALATAIAVTAYLAAPQLARVAPLPALVIALIIGIALNPIAARPQFQAGTSFAVRTLLRAAVALLGLRIALGDIVALGWGTAFIVVLAMVVTIASGLLLARLFDQTATYGALAGAGTAVCGASATLATATVLPDYPGKQADVVFVVVAVNALSTVAMVLYPPLCAWLGFDAQLTGVMLGATIHDVAQVVGAGYGVSEPAGNAAVIVKLFRVFLLFPVVIAIGWQFARGSTAGSAKVPFPLFALVFIMLCLINSVAGSLATVAPVYLAVKPLMVAAANWGLLIAIASLGLGTSLTAITALGWRHVATATGTTLVILGVTIAGLLALR
jgi:uncharacterized integral membrane protein (TIGR00698 family)